jgi:hypothetical protein
VFIKMDLDKDNAINEKTAEDNLLLNHGLNTRQKLFADAYLETGVIAEALKASGYNGTGRHVQANRLLNNAKVKDYLEKRGKYVQERVSQVAIVNGIHKESILLKAWSIVNDTTTKNADRIASLALISKILGICKPETVQNTTIWQELVQSSTIEPIKYTKPTVISDCNTTSNE